jgi:nucleotide-binding universal stress UspA family protein
MKPGRGMSMYKHLLIATDGSELAQKAIDHGLALAEPSRPKPRL